MAQSDCEIGKDQGQGYTTTLSSVTVKTSSVAQASSSSDQLLEIDLTGYKAGLYIVRINTGESTSISRIIKK